MSTFDNSSFIQIFSLPKPILNYMLDTVNGEVLKKLHKSCKYFYIKMPYTIFDYLLTDKYIEKMILQYFGEIPLNDPILNSSKRNLWLTESLYLSDLDDPKYLSKFIPKIVRCDIFDLQLDCPVTLNEFKFLTESGNIKRLILCNNYPTDAVLLPEDIFPLVPKASKIVLRPFTVTPNTMEKLLQHEHQVKIKQLRWYNIDHQIETKLIYKFLEKNLDMKPYVSICFKNGDLNEIFAAEIFEMIRIWRPKKKIPINFAYLHLLRPPIQTKIQKIRNFFKRFFCFH